MRHCEYPIQPSQQAIIGALDIFVEGCRKANVSQQLVGLSVLREATESQLECAMPRVESNYGVTRAEITAMLTR